MQLTVHTTSIHSISYSGWFSDFIPPALLTNPWTSGLAPDPCSLQTASSPSLKHDFLSKDRTAFVVLLKKEPGSGMHLRTIGFYSALSPQDYAMKYTNHVYSVKGSSGEKWQGSVVQTTTSSCNCKKLSVEKKLSTAEKQFRLWIFFLTYKRREIQSLPSNNLYLSHPDFQVFCNAPTQNWIEMHLRLVYESKTFIITNSLNFRLYRSAVVSIFGT